MQVTTARRSFGDRARAPGSRGVVGVGVDEVVDGGHDVDLPDAAGRAGLGAVGHICGPGTSAPGPGR